MFYVVMLSETNVDYHLPGSYDKIRRHFSLLKTINVALRENNNNK
jgi:hypothetical protein